MKYFPTGPVSFAGASLFAIETVEMQPTQLSLRKDLESTRQRKLLREEPESLVQPTQLLLRKDRESLVQPTQLLLRKDSESSLQPTQFLLRKDRESSLQPTQPLLRKDIASAVHPQRNVRCSSKFSEQKRTVEPSRVDVADSHSVPKVPKTESSVNERYICEAVCDAVREWSEVTRPSADCQTTFF